MDNRQEKMRAYRERWIRNNPKASKLTKKKWNDANLSERRVIARLYRENDRSRNRGYHDPNYGLEYARAYRNKHSNDRVYQLRVKASRKVNYAIARGYIERQPCANCGAKPKIIGKRQFIQAHVEDVHNPLKSIVFLCRYCNGRRRQIK
jgi:hypothetical protein